MNKHSINLRLFSSGYCTGNNSHIHKNEKSKKLSFEALWALIEHPSLGKIVLDTGYTHRFFEATRPFPNRFYRWMTPVYYQDSDAAISQLNEIGIKAEDIDHLLISHFHGDHVGGLKDFPDIPIWCSQAALKHVLSKNSWTGVFNGILTSLLPEDLEKRARHPEIEGKAEKIGPFNTWKWAEDIWFVDLPGHCRGQMGLFLRNTNMGDVMLSIDATWSSKAFRERVYPPVTVALVMDDYTQIKKTIDNLHDFHLSHPEVKILPTHCSEVAEAYLKPRKKISLS